MPVTAVQNGVTFQYPDNPDGTQVTSEFMDADIADYFAKESAKQQSEDIPQVDAEGNTSFGEGGVEVSNDHVTTLSDAFMSLVSGMNLS